MIFTYVHICIHGKCPDPSEVLRLKAALPESYLSV